MKQFYKYLLFVCVIYSVSCAKYLDIVPANVGTIDYAFRNRNEAENYLFGCYSLLQQLTNPENDGGFTTSGEVIFPVDLINNAINPAGFNLIRGLQNSANPGLNYWDGENLGKPVFKAIRRCNIMLENMDKPVDLTEDEKKRWIAETKFLKAYYHFILFRQYGPIPIIDKNQPIFGTTDELAVKREPVDAVADYMVTQLNEAIPDLPLVIQNQAKELGRITQPVALSVKAIILATAASPLFNGNPDYSSLQNKDGQPLFPSGFDATKWDKAATACLEAIKSCEANGMGLHTFIPPVNIPATLPNELRTVLSIQTSVTEKWDLNKELVWALNPEFTRQGYCTPRLTANSVINGYSNPGTFAVPISEQELFYTHHGLPINEDKTWDYANRYTIRAGDQANRYYIKKDYETVKAHFDREPRFYAALAFDGGIWYGNGKLNPESPYYVQAKGTSISAMAGPKNRQWLNVTGYWPKKLVNYQSVYDDGFQPVGYRLPLIRLAGLYLLYAEALNEQGQSYNEVVPYIDKVRTRAGLPGVVEAWTNFSNNSTKFSTKEGLRQIIHQERRIELAFEAQAGWDLRRWKELDVALSKPFQGWSIYQDKAIYYYRPVTVLTPIFNARNYLWPVKDNNLIINNNLVQNTGW